MSEQRKKTRRELPRAAGFLQIDVRLGETGLNLAAVREGMAELAPQESSLVVLPELWAAGFDYPRLGEHAERTPQILEEMRGLSRRHNICIAGSLPVKEEVGGQIKIFNTLYFVGPEGVAGTIRKQQLFAPMAEDKFFTAGADPRPVRTGLGLLAGVVCFDLRFPDLIRSQAAQGAQFLVVSAQWPAARREHWRILLRARAIENQIFVIGCNRCGMTDDTEFGGHSMIVAPDGSILAEAGGLPENTAVALDHGLLATSRKLFISAGSTPYRFPDRGKIVELPALKEIIGNYRQLGRRVVFTAGDFETLGPDQVDFLEEARRQGDCLIVGLQGDGAGGANAARVQPLTEQESRARVLAALGCVDQVVVFAAEELLPLIIELRPDVLVKRGPRAPEEIVGGLEVTMAGGMVLVVPRP